MLRHLVKVVWACLAAAVVLAFLLTRGGGRGLEAEWVALNAVFLVAGLAMAYLTVRMGAFHVRLRRFARRLLEGRYDAGIASVTRVGDELTRTEDLLNRLAEQLRQYDELRAARVRFYYGVIERLVREMHDPILLAVPEKGVLLLNPAARSLFGVERGSFALGAIEKKEANEEFMTVYRRVAEGAQDEETRDVALRLPVRDVQRRLHLRFLPLKDHVGAAGFVLMQVAEAADGRREPGTAGT